MTSGRPSTRPTRPPDVQIDDLAHPRFAPAVAEMMAAVGPFAEQMPLSLDVLAAQASTETGLDDFGDDWFREPISVVLRALTTETRLSPFGRVTTSVQFLQLLKNRLLIQDVLRRHPEIRDVPIERPVVIAGLPRTGTTHLHNLISSDPSLRSLPYWESLEPVLSEAERPGPGEPDPRLARTEAGLQFLDQALPFFKRMHEMTTWHVHEEIQLLAIAGSTMLFETSAVLSSWRDWYKANDQTPVPLPANGVVGLAVAARRHPLGAQVTPAP